MRKDARYTFKLNKTVRDKALIVSFRVESPRDTRWKFHKRDEEQLVFKARPYPNKIILLPLFCQEILWTSCRVLCAKGEYTVSQLKIFTELPAGFELAKYSGASPSTKKGRTGIPCLRGCTDERGRYFITSSLTERAMKSAWTGSKPTRKKSQYRFVGFPLESGEHRIQIDYRAPGFKAGSAASSAALAAYGLIAAAEIAERRKGDEQAVQFGTDSLHFDRGITTAVNYGLFSC